jgi:hypothetical protein
VADQEQEAHGEARQARVGQVVPELKRPLALWPNVLHHEPWAREPQDQPKNGE